MFGKWSADEDVLFSNLAMQTHGNMPDNVIPENLDNAISGLACFQ